MMKNSLENRHKRHLQVMELYELGLDIAGISHVLGVHRDTVYWHVRHDKTRRNRLAELREGEHVGNQHGRYGSLSHD